MFKSFKQIATTAQMFAVDAVLTLQYIAFFKFLNQATDKNTVPLKVSNLVVDNGRFTFDLVHNAANALPFEIKVVMVDNRFESRVSVDVDGCAYMSWKDTVMVHDLVARLTVLMKQSYTVRNEKYALSGTKAALVDFVVQH